MSSNVFAYEGDSSASFYQHIRNFRTFVGGRCSSITVRTSGDISSASPQRSFARFTFFLPRGNDDILLDLGCFIIHVPSSQTEICLSFPSRKRTEYLHAPFIRSCFSSNLIQIDIAEDSCERCFHSSGCCLVILQLNVPFI